MKKQFQKNQGFTPQTFQKSFEGFSLIEVLVYICLFTLIIGGSLISIASVIQNTEKTQTRVLVQEEADFVLAKIGWALTGASTITVGTSPPSLTVTNSGTTFLFQYATATKDITLKRGVGTATVLNNHALTVQSVSFTKTSGPPDKLQANLTINGQAFELIQNLR